MKVLRVTMPDGSKWDVPADVIAKHTAILEVSDEDPGFERDSKLVDWYFSILEDNKKLIECSKEIDWSAVVMDARPEKHPDVDYSEGWYKGKREVLDI